MLVYYHDENGNTVEVTIPNQSCDHCNDDMFFIEADLMRASIGCFTCDAHRWVNFNDDGTLKNIIEDE